MGFTGEQFYLSNEYPCDIRAILYGKEYVFSSAEALWQAKRVTFSSLAEKDKLSLIECLTKSTPKEAIAIGKGISPLSGDGFLWETFRPIVMESVINCKFNQNPELARLLFHEDLESIACETSQEEETLTALRHFRTMDKGHVCPPNVANLCGDGYAKRRTILENGNTVYNYTEIIRENDSVREVNIVKWDKNRFSNTLETLSYTEAITKFTENVTFEDVEKLFEGAREISEEYVLE